MVDRMLYEIAFTQTFEDDAGRRERNDYTESVVFRGDAAGAIDKLVKAASKEILPEDGARRRSKCVGVHVKSVRAVCKVHHL